MIKKRNTYLWFYIEFFFFLLKRLLIVLYILSKHYYFIGCFYTTFNKDFYNNTITINMTLKLETIIRSCIISYWKKILFKGKSYKIKVVSKGNKITLRMGFSHWTKFVLHSFTGYIYKYGRQKFIIFTPIFLNLALLVAQISKIRPINPYTKRGLRFSQQYIKRRSGKLSQALSSLH